MPGSTTTSPSHSSTATNHSIDDEESALLLKIISTFDFETVNQAQYKKALNARKGKHAAPNRGVRGGCRDYKVRIAKLASFYELSYDDQKKANKAYTADAPTALKSQCKSNIKYLNSRAAKVAAFRAHPRGVMIAGELNFDLLQNFEDDDLDLEEDANEDDTGAEAPSEEDFMLKAYLSIDLETVNQARYKKALNARKGKHAAPNRGVRGGCRDYKVRIAKLASFYELSYDDQKRANRAYSKDVSATLKKRHKKNLFFLNRMAVKANAIRNHSNPIRSAAIAEEFNLDIASMNIDDQEGLSDEDEDLEPYVHTGLASSGESYQ